MRARSIALVTTLALGFVALGPASPCLAADADGHRCEVGTAALARIDGVDITRAEVEAQVAGPLRNLEQQKFDLLQTALAQVIEDRLLELEADRLDTTAQALVAEAGAAEVSQAEVDAWYEENKARVRRPKEQVEEQVRNFLAQQKTLESRRQVVDGLESRYAVERLLEPYRIEVGEPSGPLRGNPNAAVTVTVFSDFQCPFCQRLVPALDELEKTFGNDIAISFRHFPLDSIHPDARRASEAVACADRQDGFWKLHDAIFEDNSDLSASALVTKARQVGLDGDRFEACLSSGQGAEAVVADVAAGQKAGVTGTPAIFVNGRPVALRNGRPTAEQIADVVKIERKRAAGAAAAGR